MKDKNTSSSNQPALTDSGAAVAEIVQTTQYTVLLSLLHSKHLMLFALFVLATTTNCYAIHSSKTSDLGIT
jgi:hypothetical protein